MGKIADWLAQNRENHQAAQEERKNNKSFFSWIGLEPLEQLWNDWTGNTNIDKQLAAQAAENDKVRAENLAQWQRENEYNSPAAQKARLQAAGLNADLMYGQGGISNTATSAPPRTPMDWSSLANKKTVGQSIMEGLAIQQARANIKKTEGEARQAGMNADILEKYGVDTADMNKEYLRESIEKLANESKVIDLNSSEAQLNHDFRNAFREEIIQNKLQKLTAETKMTANALEEDIKTLSLRIAGINAENSRLDRMSNFTTEEWGLVVDVIKELFRLLK